jgi:diguanylate cyclase (GGDEF)-like protein/PAS domain S-box-containing protein
MTAGQEKIRTILIVDDIPENVSLLEAVLSSEYTIRTATRGSEALEIVQKTPPDLILLDIMMPEMNGYEVCRALKANAATKAIPVIFVTALLTPGDETLGFEAGGVDYLKKPFIGAIVRSRVKAHLALKEAHDEMKEWNSNLKKRLLHSITTIRKKTEALTTAENITNGLHAYVKSVELLKTEIQDAREYAEDIVETVREPLVVLNSELNILTANHSFYNTFKVTADETIGNFIYDLGNRQWDIPKLRVLFEEIILNHIVFNGYEVEHEFPGIGRKVMLLNARQIYREKIGSHIILLAMEDITGRKQLEEERDRLAMIVEFSNDAIFSISLDDTITSWNRGAENIFGYSAREIIGCPIFTLIPAERYHERAQILQTVLSGEKVEHFETTRIRKDGSQINVSITTSPILNEDGKIISNSVIARDVTERRKMEDVIKHQARHDTLTDLPNRLLFMEFLTLGLAQARRSGKKLALMFLDLNGFKKVNDTLGHSCGDRLLQEVALRLKASIRESDTVARLGGDEFTVLMPNLGLTDDVSIVLKKILGVFETPFILDDVAVDTSTSIGVCIFPDDGECSEELMKKADTAMYDAKGSGRNSYQYYNV